jgi:hypothetical protein
MKCLSLIQPWATLILTGAKTHETRRWSTSHRGLLAIHASRTVPLGIQHLCDEEPFCSALRAAGYESAVELPRGVILGTVELLDVLAVDRLDLSQLPPREIAFGDFSPGRFAWKLANPVLFAEPLSVRGKPGLFQTDEHSSPSGGR